MPPRGLTNPAPKTESAREARKSFFCELCQKGYSRMNEFEAHESSYDHQHKKRLKEMKQMQRDPLASSKARRAERKADEKSGLRSITIKPVKLDVPPPPPSQQQQQGSGSGSTTAGAAGSELTSIAGGGGGGGGGGFRKGGFKKAFIGSVGAAADEADENAEDQKEEGGRAGFKKAFIATDSDETRDAAGARLEREGGKEEKRREPQQQQEDGEESDTEDEGYDMYDPRHPTD
ncbi:MAG: hypothetical protein M1816_002437 [Peltula sp. TS41687]|nr:MAG: hypothetical protein M1816_002437 [Peltula sp. TS41687]